MIKTVQFQTGQKVKCQFFENIILLKHPILYPDEYEGGCFKAYCPNSVCLSVHYHPAKPEEFLPDLRSFGYPLYPEPL